MEQLPTVALQILRFLDFNLPQHVWETARGTP